LLQPPQHLPSNPPRYFKNRITVSQWRQICRSISFRFITSVHPNLSRAFPFTKDGGTGDDDSDDEAGESELSSALNQQAGHNNRTARGNYGTDFGDIRYFNADTKANQEEGCDRLHLFLDTYGPTRVLIEGNSVVIHRSVKPALGRAVSQ